MTGYLRNALGCLLVSALSGLAVSQPVSLLLEPFTVVLPNASIPNAALPFNSSNLGTAVMFTTPSGRVVSALPFFTQNFSRALAADNVTEVLTPTSSPFFAVRFAPTELGLHTYMQHSVPPGIAPINGAFLCAGGPLRPGDGFARVAEGGAYFTLGDGAFWLVGENMAWSGCYPYYNGSCAFDNPTGGTYMYDRMLPKLARVGGNWIRLWLGPSLARNVISDGELGSFLDFAIQAMGAPFGSYNLEAAWRVDYVVSLARKLGVKITVVLDAQQSFDPPSFWVNSTYNVANGGPLNTNDSIWASPAAVAEFAQRWSYVLARYGYSSSIFAWELQNEANDWPGGFSSEALAVQLDLLQRVLDGDTYGHMVVNSFSGKSGSASQINAFQSDPRVAFTSVHVYPNPDFQLPCDLAATVWKMVGPQARRLGKPCFIEEFGATYLGPQQHTLDPHGIGLRTGAWASLVGGAAGTAMQWFWAETDTLDTYAQLGGAAVVSRSISADLLELSWENWSDGAFVPASIAHAGWSVGLSRTTNTTSSVLAYAYAVNFTQCGSHYISAVTSGAKLTLNGLSTTGVSVNVTFYNTTTGAPLPGGAAVLAGGQLIVSWPDFLEDAAVHVVFY